jgi:hypothetical protein
MLKPQRLLKRFKHDAAGVTPVEGDAGRNDERHEQRYYQTV